MTTALQSKTNAAKKSKPNNRNICRAKYDTGELKKRMNIDTIPVQHIVNRNEELLKGKGQYDGFDEEDTEFEEYLQNTQI